MNRYLGTLVASALLTFGALTGSFADTATLLPNAVQQFFDNNGKPLATGTAGFYVPSTLTPKTVWTSSDESVPQTNPVPLSLSGRPTSPIYGNGIYRQILKDKNGAVIWDALTSSTGGGGGGTAPAFSEGVMVGTIISWANMVLPAKYLYTAGQAVSRATYPDLYTALTFTTSVLCQSGIATITVSTDISDKVPVGAPVEFSCFAPGTTIIAKSSGTLTLSTNATATTSVSGAIFPWGNGNGSTTFNVPNINGRTIVGRNNMGGTASSVLTSTYFRTPALAAVDPNAINAIAGSQSHTITAAESAALNSSVVAAGSAGTFTTSGSSVNFRFLDQAGGGTAGFTSTGSYTERSGNSASAQVSVTGTAATTNAGGSPHTVMQPSVTADYIIKALPDDTPGGPGVSSIQGMTGAIACGTNMTCTGNIISSTAGTITVNTTPVNGGTNNGVFYNNAGTMGNTAAGANGQLFAGVTAGAPNFVTMSQDASITAAGVITVLRTNNVLFAASATTDTTNATNISSGTLPSARISGSYTGLTGVGTLTAGATGAGFTMAFGTSTLSGQIPIANGGTSQSTATAARSSTGLNVDGATSTGDANYTIQASDRTVFHTALTAARTDTLPAANSVNAGQVFVINDFRGVASASNTITLQRAGADTINGVTSVVAINVQYGAGIFWSDGSSRWTFFPATAGGGGGTVTQVTPGAGLVSATTTACAQTAITTTGSLFTAECINAQTGTSYAIVDGDRAKLVTAVNAAAQAYTIAQAGTASNFQTGWYTDVKNNSTNVNGIVTITPTTSTINGAANYVLKPGSSVRIVSDGTNYQTVLEFFSASTKVEQETGTSANTAVTPLHQQNHDSAAKMVVFFTPAASPVVLFGYNVTSVTKGGTGNFTVNLTTSFASANFACVASAQSTSAAGGYNAVINGQTASTVNILTVNSGAVTTDPGTGVNVTCYGRQ